MKSNAIRVYVVEPGKDPYQRIMKNELEAFQEAVGGHIETVSVTSDCVIICDEEGLLKDYPMNCEICGHWFFGTILFVGVDGEEFADVPLSWAEFKKMFDNLFFEEAFK